MDRPYQPIYIFGSADARTTSSAARACVPELCRGKSPFSDVLCLGLQR
ncbi:hypothetical protein ID866_11318 [Astraeus odoratus]|nr:hypothetical protein ID866_11318 [Astraeus odoratus]